MATREVPTAMAQEGDVVNGLTESWPNGKSRICHTAQGCLKCTNENVFTLTHNLILSLQPYIFSLESNLLGCNDRVQSGFQPAALLPQPFSSYYLD